MSLPILCYCRMVPTKKTSRNFHFKQSFPQAIAAARSTAVFPGCQPHHVTQSPASSLILLIDWLYRFLLTCDWPSSLSLYLVPVDTGRARWVVKRDWTCPLLRSLVGQELRCKHVSSTWDIDSGFIYTKYHFVSNICIFVCVHGCVYVFGNQTRQA